MNATTEEVDVVLIDGAHLASVDSSHTWCGRSVVGGVMFVLEPGADFGEAGGDCPECARQLREGRR